MDGVLRKPLSLVELRQCFKTFLGDDIECISDEEETPQVQEGINISLIELIGKSQAKANVALFKQWMPIYLDELETAYEDYLCKHGYETKRVRCRFYKIKECSRVGRAC